jgi:hypothetical protein
MGAWTKKPCFNCGKKKGQKQANRKFCYTCQKINDKNRSRTAHGNAILKTYGITLEQYEALYELQGGVCYLCRHAKGVKRRLTVDHDHKCCAELPACGKCVRGLLCQGCNRNVLAWAARDSIDFFVRGIEYLTNPPFRAILEAAESSGASYGRTGRNGAAR